MALSGHQTRRLRGLAHHLSPTVIIGKAGVSEGIVTQADESLEARELVKCSVLEASGLAARDAAARLAEGCGAQVVQVIGRRFSLYRLSGRDDVEHIKLD